jgi:acylphosphatase
MDSDQVRRRVVVHGRVQGVFFRDSVQEEAHAAGVAGWVRNREDGTVEVVLEGTDDAVARVVEFCRHGPRRADVDRVDVEDEAAEGISGFSVR